MAPKPCRICNGKQTTACMICGWKAKAVPKKLTVKEIQARKRLDFLGTLYNRMRKFRMLSTGYIGSYQGRRVIVCKEEIQDQLAIIDGDEKKIVADSEVTNIQDPIDQEIFDKIGDPLALDSKEYQPFYQPKKHEV